ncbi:50S ribosomal protein L30 [Nymphaea thermarum]|nr:50S ribosomal protein L30 [Nymphaea thermarum]
MNSAFNAFKASVGVGWSPHLYITLVRGIPGTRRLHRRTLEALRLGKCNRTVMRWNTPTVRGMIQQVKRLVVVETEEMYNARKQKEAAHKALRPPIVVNHLPPPPPPPQPSIV